MPAESTYTPIASTTLGSNTTTIDFQNISQAYTDLVCVAFVRGTNATATVDFMLRVNNNTGNIYDGAYLRGTGTSAGTARYNNTSYAAPIGTMVAASASANIFSQHIITFHDYSLTTINKTFLADNGAEYNSAGFTELVCNQFFSTAAVSRLTFLCSSGDFATGSIITLYGLKAA